MYHFVTSSHHMQLKVLCKWKYRNILIMAEEKKKCTNPPMLSLLLPSILGNFWTRFSSRMLMGHKTGHVIISNLYLIDCNTISYPLKSQSQSHGFCSIFHSKSKKSHLLKLPSLLFKFELLHLYNWWHWTTYLTLTSNIQIVLIYLKVHLSGSEESVQFHIPFMTFIPQKNLQWRVVC
jgi:hypothetical protein